MSHAATFPTVTSHRSQGIASRIVAALKAAYARRCERLAYEDLLSRDSETFRDIGVTRGDVRQAMTRC